MNTQEQIGKNVEMYTRFIQYIALNGCNKIKCKKCLLNGICDRTPNNGRQVAEAFLRDSAKMAEEKEKSDTGKKE